MSFLSPEKQKTTTTKKNNNRLLVSTILGQDHPSILARGDLGIQHPVLNLRIKPWLLTLVGSTSKTTSAEPPPQLLCGWCRRSCCRNGGQCGSWVALRSSRWSLGAPRGLGHSGGEAILFPGVSADPGQVARDPRVDTRLVLHGTVTAPAHNPSQNHAVLGGADQGPP